MNEFDSLIATVQMSLVDQISLLQSSSDVLGELDELKISLAQALNRIKLLVCDKVREGTLTVRQKNVISFANGAPLVFISEKSLKIGSTQKAIFAVIWGGQGHGLNILQHNNLTINTKEASIILGLLCMFAQLEKLKFDTIHILTEGNLIAKILTQYKDWAEKNFVMNDGSEMDNAHIWRLLAAQLEKTCFKIEVTEEPNDNLRYKFAECYNVFENFRL